MCMSHIKERVVSKAGMINEGEILLLLDVLL